MYTPCQAILLHNPALPSPWRCHRQSPSPHCPCFLHRIIKNQYQKLICSYIATSSDIHEAQPTLCGMTGRGRKTGGRGRVRETRGGGFMTALGPCLVTFVCDPAAMQKK